MTNADFQTDVQYYVVLKTNSDQYEDEVHNVMVDFGQRLIHCDCNMFINIGILCCHALRVMDVNNSMGLETFVVIPNHYILKIWTNDTKKDVCLDLSVSNHQSEGEDYNVRYKNLCSMMVSTAGTIIKEKKSYDNFVSEFHRIVKNVVQSTNNTINSIDQVITEDVLEKRKRISDAVSSKGRKTPAMLASLATKISPRRGLKEDNHKRGRSLESGIRSLEKDDDLILFNEAQNKKMESFLLQ
ncbi:uncharacterized protein LOC127257298 [Andrographis paniculata]|uniref:uncharacterized protein LOC127257298 n=1 Tax=Andrographis paniculata TaxID=175694 RepID=UPI0021E8B443|nr:uncharacterized protein LOC127257298 [Andrographis paniculata]